MLEHAIEDHLRVKMKEIGGWAIKLIGLAGLPDRLVLYRGRAYFVELKRPKRGIISPIQRVVHEKLRRLGFNVRILNTKEQVDGFIFDIIRAA